MLTSATRRQDPGKTDLTEQNGVTLVSYSKRIDDLARLEEGWNDGQGSRISPAAINAARKLAACLQPGLFHIFPQINGGILFESDVAFEFSVDPSGEVEMDEIEME
jgi:hypothetical protein